MAKITITATMAIIAILLVTRVITVTIAMPNITVKCNGYNSHTVGYESNNSHDSHNGYNNKI